MTRPLGPMRYNAENEVCCTYGCAHFINWDDGFKVTGGSTTMSEIQVSVIDPDGKIVRYRCDEFSFEGAAFVMGNATLEHGFPNEPASVIALYPVPGTTIGIAR